MTRKRYSLRLLPKRFIYVAACGLSVLRPSLLSVGILDETAPDFVCLIVQISCVTDAFLACVFARGLFSRKQKESASAPGWKLFGKVPPRESPPKDFKTIQQVNSRSHKFQYRTSDLVPGRGGGILLFFYLNNVITVIKQDYRTCIVFALKLCNLSRVSILFDVMVCDICYNTVKKGGCVSVRRF